MGVRFSAPVQTGRGAHLAFCTMGTGSFSGIKRPGRGVDHPPPSRAEVRERVVLYLYSPSGASWPFRGCKYLLNTENSNFVSVNVVLKCGVSLCFGEIIISKLSVQESTEFLLHDTA